jgi:hypothetical protein
VHALRQALVEVVEHGCPHRMARAHRIVDVQIGRRAGPPDIVARLARHDMTERSDTADMIEPRLTNEPIENADANDPMLPIESIEPTDPMDRIDPRDPILRIEPSDLIDNKDRCVMHPSCRMSVAAQRVQERALTINTRSGRRRARAFAARSAAELGRATTPRAAKVRTSSGRRRVRV